MYTHEDDYQNDQDYSDIQESKQYDRLDAWEYSEERVENEIL